MIERRSGTSTSLLLLTSKTWRIQMPRMRGWNARRRLSPKERRTPTRKTLRRKKCLGERSRRKEDKEDSDTEKEEDKNWDEEEGQEQNNDQKEEDHLLVPLSVVV